MSLSTQTPNTRSVLSVTRARITGGRYAQGSKLPPERSLAEEFGVKRGEIRRALAQLEDDGLISREPRCRPTVRSGFEAASSHPGVANPVLRTSTIAVVLPQHPRYPAAALILHGINLEIRCGGKPCRTVVYDTHGDTRESSAQHEVEAMQALALDNVDGVILWHHSSAQILPYLARLNERKIPVVFVDRYPSEVGCDFVGVDNFSAAMDATRYLIGLGHRRIAHLTSSDSAITVTERRLGYLESLRSIGVEPQPDWIYEAPQATAPPPREAVEQFLYAKEPPTAVFAMNDALAHYFIRDAEDLGFSVPDKLSVIGFDDMERFSPRPPVLSTVHQPFETIGRRAIKVLQSRLGLLDLYGAATVHVLLPTRLIERQSCKQMMKGGAFLVSVG